MTNLLFDCPGCGQSLDAPGELASQLIDCPTCGQKIEVPTRSSNTCNGTKPVDYAKTCPTCGLRHPDREEPDAPPKPPPPDVIRCPQCRSTQLTAQKKGFNFGKAAVGGVLLGGVGVLLGGGSGANQVKITCLRCGHVFVPGQGAR